MSISQNPSKTTTARRHFLGQSAAGLAIAALPFTASAATNVPATASLDRAKWSARNHAALSTLIEKNGSSSPKYDAKRKPYAVFDWDNTAIMNDTEEALLVYQINTLGFRLSPQEFSAIIRQNVPAGPFSADYNNSAGKAVTLEDLASDLDLSYAWLHANYNGFKGTLTLDAIRETVQFQDFKAKLYYLYEAVNGTHGVDVGYPWVVYFFTNMSVEEVGLMTERSNDVNLGLGLAKSKFTSPASLPGRAGVVSISHFQGIRLTTEIASLMDALRNHGIEVYVCTASLEDVVAVFASLPKYGFGVPTANVLGLRLEKQGNVYTNRYKKDWPLTWGPGKTVAIQRELVAKKGYGPLLVAGDSDGDYDMLRDFPDTQLGLIVNRLKKGKIGELSKWAADIMPTQLTRYVLQGRQESTGNWLPMEKSLKYGNNTAQLLG